MTADNRTLLALVAAGLLAAAAGVALRYLDPASGTGATLGWAGLAAAQLTGLWLLLRNGTLLRTGFFRGILASYGVLLVGALFKILHWKGGDALVLAPLAGIAGLYLAHFLRKPRQQLPDVLKLLWVLSFCGATAGILLHWLPREAGYVPQALLWLCLLAFVRQSGQSVAQ